MIIRSRSGKMKVTLSINYNVYIILYYKYPRWIREGAMDDTSDGPGKSDGCYE